MPNRKLNYRIAISITALAIVFAAALYLEFPRDRVKTINDSPSHRDSARNSAAYHAADELITIPPAVVRKLDGRPNDHDNLPLVEVVTSIYKQDLAYRVMAQRVAEEMIEHHETSRYLRWEPVRIDPLQMINGSYLRDGALPRSLSIKPFTDANFVVDQTDYTVYSEDDGAVWEGMIRGVKYGKVIITISGGLETPSFDIGIYTHQHRIRVLPTDVATVYIAIEIDSTKAGQVRQ